MTTPDWIDLGPTEQLKQPPLRQVAVGRTKVALSWNGRTFGAIHDACNHVGGPLGQGTLDGDYVVCPWHNWKFHHATGQGEPGYEQDCVPSYRLEERAGHLWICEEPGSARHKTPHARHALDREPLREPGPLRVLAISTTAMDRRFPRYSTSEALLESALTHAGTRGFETRMLRLADLSFRACEGYYSKSKHACTWPCSITQMDPGDQMTEVYEGLVFWADIVLVGTPIRWGAASSLYFKMAERLNTVQNQITLKERVLLRNKVGGLVITGGQDNIQAVAGQMLTFFGELGVQFPQFPFIAHSRGWTAEDMERNVAFVQRNADLHEGARALLDRCADLSGRLLATDGPGFERGGRKACPPQDPQAR